MIQNIKQNVKNELHQTDIQQLQLSDIIANFETFAYRDQLNQQTVDRYHQIIDDLPPLDVFQIDGQYFLVGGFHRLEAHKKAERPFVTAKIYQGTYTQAKQFACKANSTHGLNLSQSERKRALTDFIKFSLLEDPFLSNGAISQAFGGTSEATVRRYRKKLEESGELEQLTERRGADGKVYQTKSIGQSGSSTDEAEASVHLIPHPYNTIFPFDKTAYHQIKDSLSSMGLLEPITLYEGKILDGKIRYQACIDTDIKPNFKTFPDDFPHYRGDASDFVISSNLRLHRTEENGLRMSLPIANITRDPDIHIRKGTDPNVVSRCAEEMKRGDKFPPVLVVSDNGNNWLFDGFHRLEAAESIGLDQFDVDLCDGDYKTALYLACTVNATHGSPNWEREIKQ